MVFEIIYKWTLDKQITADKVTYPPMIITLTIDMFLKMGNIVLIIYTRQEIHFIKENYKSKYNKCY